MTSSPEPVPQRIGDAERDQAATYLREALAEGRLEQAEFDERLDQALRARTMSDLEPLFADLPGPKPGQAVTPTFEAPPWQRTPAGPEPSSAQVAVPPAPDQSVAPAGLNRFLDVAAWAAWPVTIMLLFATSWHYWWLIFIPIVISSMAGNRHQRHRRRRDS
ncbi:MAG TPA: DUF1707 domain-containing protein [Microlunatus sp.]|nr:DUF1707 domain-containing protein [Microlunatus sp.]